MTRNRHQQSTIELEHWLQMLLNTYANFPSKGLAQVIVGYIERVNHQDNGELTNQQRCMYASMQRFWRWRSS